jgi:acyl-coenzyme A thioesterase PaaI-like protein
MNGIKAAWSFLSRIPSGKFFFSKAIRLFVPYSGSIDARVLELRSGYALLKLKDRKFVRNHLNSIHAIALANLGELCSGLAFVWSLPPEMKGIVTEIRIEYHKKARGTLYAESTSPTLETKTSQIVQVQAQIIDQAKNLVCTVHVTWKIDLAS